MLLMNASDRLQKSTQWARREHNMSHGGCLTTTPGTPRCSEAMASRQRNSRHVEHNDREHRNPGLRDHRLRSQRPLSQATPGREPSPPPAVACDTS